MHAGAQVSESENQSQLGLGQDLFFRINEGKVRGGQLTDYRRAALHVLDCVYGNAAMFARLQPAGRDGMEENPLRRWVRLNKHDELCEFVAVMLFAPEEQREKRIRAMQQDYYEGWTCPQRLAPMDYWRQKFAGRNWSRVLDHVGRGIDQYSKRRDFAEVVAELAARRS